MERSVGASGTHHTAPVGVCEASFGDGLRVMPRTDGLWIVYDESRALGERTVFVGSQSSAMRFASDFLRGVG